MTSATQVITSFLGGEISQYAQGRYDRPDYRTSMRVCLNSFPVESGAWTRRPGTQHAGFTRGGAPGRVLKFDFSQANAVTMEFTDAHLRFRSGATVISTNDATTIVAISTANPAVVQLSAAVSWSTGDCAFFSALGSNDPLLQNRRFTLTKIDTTHFSIADEVTSAAIDGSTLGTFVSGTLNRVHDLSTVYTAGLWSNIRTIQAETTTVLLSPTLPPQAVTVTTTPVTGLNAQFSIGQMTLNDGPYLDPFTNGVQVSPNATSGIISLQLSFSNYDSAKAYASGAFVTSSGVNYVSLVDQNVGNTPISSPSAWSPTSAGAAINSGQGFLGTDIGRLVRLFSEPDIWDVGTAYGVGSVVSYNPTGAPGAAVYYAAAATSTGVIPGTDLSKWTIAPSGVSVWTWGKIVSLSNTIDRALAGSISVGDMSGGGGLNAAFDGQFSQNSAGCAQAGTSGGFTIDGTQILFSTFVGKNYSGASAQRITQVTVYPSADKGLVYGTVSSAAGVLSLNATVTLNLRASNVLPANASSGTLLGTSGQRANGVAPSTIISSDQTTAWNYVWVEMIANTVIFTGRGSASGYTLINTIGQLSFFSPTGTGTSTGVNIEILGPALLRTTPIRTWRLGAFSNTTGWPTCGTYHEGRLWVGGAIANRFDACVSNGISGSTINFAPTDATGAVAVSNAISYTLNSDGVNPMFWMQPDLQGVVIGTQAGEWLVQAPTTGPIAPTNIVARRMTKHGSANIQPVRTEHANIFVKRYKRKVMEYFADAYSGKFSAPNLADKAQHIPRSGVDELAYTEAVNPVIWGRNHDGSFFGITYKRETLTTSQPPAFYGWHPHTLGSGRAVESVCSGPSVGGDLDTLTMVTNDSTTGFRHVELLTDAPDELTGLSSSWFLDNAVNPSSIVISSTSAVLNGLWHLNGLTVQIFAGGLDLGDPGDEGTNPTDFVVANGSVTITYGDGISAGPGRGLFTRDFATALSLSQIVVGFTYNSDGQIVRLIAQADTGARNGPALGAPSRTHRAAIKFVNSKGISIGGNFSRLYPCLFRASIDSPRDLPVLSTYTGIFFDQVKDDFTYDDSLCWRVTRPFPATITACAQNLRTEDM